MDNIKCLNLFTGAGGGILGEMRLGWSHVGYVEIDIYCQKILAQRIKDGIIKDAPIFGDIRSFIDQGFALAYKGMVDIISAGFPCQPFSVAGKRAGSGDERNMWPSTLEAICIIRPEVVWLENVPGLLSSGYFGRILSDLSKSGYNARWKIISAAEMGAPHKRDRLWILANATNIERKRNINSRGRRSGFTDGGSFLANATSRKPRKSTKWEGRKGSRRRSQEISNAQGPNDRKFNPKPSPGHIQQPGVGIISGDVSNPYSTERKGHRKHGREILQNSESKRFNIDNPGWWSAEPGMGRVANGVANRVDKLKALGNGIVPKLDKTAFITLRNL